MLIFPETVSEANEWLRRHKRYDLKFTARSDYFFGNTYIISFMNREVYTSTSIKDCIEYIAKYYNVPLHW